MAVSNLIKVLLIDDHVKVRQGVRELLSSYPNIEVVGEAGDGEEGVHQVQQLQPSVVVMDISMPKMDGIMSTRLIKIQYPRILVVGLSVFTQHSGQREEMIKAGAFEVIGKERAVEELYSAIQKAVASLYP